MAKEIIKKNSIITISDRSKSPIWLFSILAIVDFGFFHSMGNDTVALFTALILFGLGLFVFHQSGRRVSYVDNAQGVQDLFNRLTNKERIYSLTWQQLEQLTTLVFHKLGYETQRYGGDGPDGGIDVMATKDGKKVIIQCKNWHTQNVGVQVAREMLGVMTKEQVDEVFIVCCHKFSKPCKEFVNGTNIHLVHGYLLYDWVDAIKKGRTFDIRKRAINKY